jgi:hypothetical protein
MAEDIGQHAQRQDADGPRRAAPHRARRYNAFRFLAQQVLRGARARGAPPPSADDGGAGTAGAAGAEGAALGEFVESANAMDRWIQVDGRWSHSCAIPLPLPLALHPAAHEPGFLQPRAPAPPHGVGTRKLRDGRGGR